MKVVVEIEDPRLRDVPMSVKELTVLLMQIIEDGSYRIADGAKITSVNLRLISLHAA